MYLIQKLVNWLICKSIQGQLVGEKYLNRLVECDSSDHFIFGEFLTVLLSFLFTCKDLFSYFRNPLKLVIPLNFLNNSMVNLAVALLG